MSLLIPDEILHASQLLERELKDDRRRLIEPRSAILGIGQRGLDLLGIALDDRRKAASDP